MSEPVWSPEEAARLLAEVYANSLGEASDSDIDPVTQEELARALDADPEYLEQTWEVWRDALDLYDWSEKQVDEARYWLDAEFLGGLAVP